MTGLGQPARRAVFLDRDGVLIEDCELLTDMDRIRLLPGVPEATRLLAEADLRRVVVTNQTVVSRGLCSLEDVRAINAEIERRLLDAGGSPMDLWCVCPHHPHADVPEYRQQCDCRKPAAGMLLRAAEQLHIDLAGSFLVGDRISDIAAGAAAGCRTIQLTTGRHLDPPIQSPVSMCDVVPDATCPSLLDATQWILHESNTR